MYTIRRTSDLELIATLNSEIFYNEPLGDELRRSIWWVVRKDGEAIGFCGARDLKEGTGSWFLSRSGLKISARGKGLQRRMIHARCAHIRRSGGRHALTFTLNSNAASINNLIRAGFKVYTPEWAWAREECEGYEIYWAKKLVDSGK